MGTTYKKQKQVMPQYLLKCIQYQKFLKFFSIDDCFLKHFLLLFLYSGIYLSVLNTFHR